MSMRINPLLCILLCIYAALFIYSLTSGVAKELTYSILLTLINAQAFNLALGYSGLVNLGQAGFLGIGTYAFYAVTSFLYINPFIAVILGGFITMAIAISIGYFTARFRGFLFVFGTMILAAGVPYLIMGLDIMGGAEGILTYKDLSPFYNFDIILTILFLTSLLTTILTFIIVNSRIGYSLKAIRDDEDAAATSGVNVLGSKLIVFAISAFILGIAGGLRLFKVNYLSPSTAFSMAFTIEAMVVTLTGGPGTLIGPFLGTLIYQILKDLLMRTIPGLQLFIFGVLVVIMGLCAPEGFAGILKKKIRGLQKVEI
ncbi:MAG: branched-chain amino acid ABC transporter permease [Candidatus Bathyarchaeia archaeon]